MRKGGRVASFAARVARELARAAAVWSALLAMALVFAWMLAAACVSRVLTR
jgi:hypothetical protein